MPDVASSKALLRVAINLNSRTNHLPSFHSSLADNLLFEVVYNTEDDDESGNRSQHIPTQRVNIITRDNVEALATVLVAQLSSWVVKINWLIEILISFMGTFTKVSTKVY